MNGMDVDTTASSHQNGNEIQPSSTRNDFSSVNSNIAIDKLIQDYLRAKGYASAASAMENEILSRHSQDRSVRLADLNPVDLLIGTTGVKSDSSITNATDYLDLVEAVYSKSMQSSEFNAYVSDLNEFSSWVFSSFEIVKSYLLAVLFAVFCHCYIAIIRGEQSELAENLIVKYGEYFQRSFSTELQQLTILRSSDQLRDDQFLQNNNFIRSVLQGKFTVQMSSFALQLLSQKLRQDNLVMIASIINQKVIFQKFDSIDGDLVDQNIHESSSLLSLPGYASEPAADSNVDRLVLGVAGMGDVAKHWKERSTLFSDIEFPNIANDSLMKKWTSSLIRPRSLLRKMARSDGSIPNAFDDRALDQLVQRGGSTTLLPNPETIPSTSSSSEEQPPQHAPGKYGDTLNPSVVCATISNAYDNLISMDITPSVQQIATGHHDSIVRVWRLNQTPEEQQKLPWFGRNLPAPYSWEMNTVLPVPQTASETGDGSKNNKGGLVSNSDKNASSNGSAAASTPYPCVEFVGHSMPVYSVAQSPCERFVFSASADDSIRVWDTAVVQCVGQYHCFATPWHVRVSPVDTYYFAAGNSDRTVTVYGMDRNAPIRLMTGHTGDVNAVSWHGNGVLLASGGNDRSVRLWDIRSAKCPRTFNHCSAAITALQISSVGTLVAAGTENGKVFVWDIRTSRQLAILQGHTEEVTSLSFSKDRNQALCSGSLDCSVRVWDLRLALETTYNYAAAQHVSSDYAVAVLKARNAFFTKACPVYHVGYTDRGMVYCGGMYSSSAATTIHQKNIAENSTAIAEQTLVKSFGMSSVVPTKSAASSSIL